MSCNSAFFLSEHLLKMPLEDLREFLQERISSSFHQNDDDVIEQLQVSMNELRRMKLDLPPACMLSYLSLCLDALQCSKPIKTTAKVLYL